MTDTWPTDAPDPHEHEYKLFAAWATEDEIDAWFRHKYGQPPEWIIEWKSWLYVGPIPEAS